MQTPSPARPATAWKLAALGRWSLLLLLAGHRRLRQKFAHLNLSTLIQMLLERHWVVDLQPRGRAWIPGLFDYAFITELVLLALFPLALHVWRKRYEHPAEASPGAEDATWRMGAGSLFGLAFLLWADFT